MKKGYCKWFDKYIEDITEHEAATCIMYHQDCLRCNCFERRENEETEVNHEQ